MIEHSSDRVAAPNAPTIEEEVDRRIEREVHYFARHPDEIEARLRELDEEWDIERILQRNASVVSLLGLTLGLCGRRLWLLLPLVAQGFLLQHALEGRCAPMALLRRLGFRTRAEIGRERYALKALRGDFHWDEDTDAPAAAEQALSAVS